MSIEDLTMVLKHLPGKHDQKAHGRKGVGFTSVTLAEVKTYPAIHNDPAAAADYALYNPEPAVVLAMRVKAKHVFAMGYTGLGNPNSSEVIVEASGVSGVHKILE